MIAIKVIPDIFDLWHRVIYAYLKGWRCFKEDVLMRFYSMKLLSLCVFLSAICVLAAAEDKVKGQLPAQYKKLGLRDDQVQKIYKIQTDYRGKGAELEKQLKELKTKEKTEVEGVLTDEQKNRLKEIRTGESADPKKTSK